MNPEDRLGPYEIIEQLGAGGMGEVWLAEDTRLGRKVAVKVLPAQFAGDPERLARFEQEARAAAALNHPHIAAVYDVGAEPGEDGTSTHFIVQEYLEGQPLRDLLDRGTPEMRKALALGMEIGEALKAAHRAGIVHRDLKPENVFVTPDGHAKVLDFGLAKLTEMNAGPLDSQSMSPTVLGTQAGAIMGTAGYMAPEQVQGEEVDARADVFALGCVLWEMVSGRRAFAGKSVPHTLHKILDEEPEGSDTEIGKGLPLRLRWLLERALAKSPEERTQSAGDVVAELRQIATEIDSGTAITEAAALSSEPAPAAEPVRAGISWKAAVPAGVVLVLLSLLGATLLAPAVPEPVVHRFRIDYPADATVRTNFTRGVAISPDGRWITFAAGAQLWLRPLGDFEALPIRGTENASRVPTFSPTSDALAYYNADQMRRIALSGGAPVTLTGTPDRPHGAEWAADGYVYYGQGASGIFRVSENGGDAEVVVAGEGETLSGAQLLPGGEWLLFTTGSGGGYSTPSVEAMSMTTRERKTVVPGGADGRYAPTGHLVYVVDGNLLAQRFDLERAEVVGGPIVAVEGVRFSASGAADYAVSANGTLVYRSGGSGGGAELALTWVGRDGQNAALSFPPAGYDWPAVSPDGSRVAVQTQESGPSVIWIQDLERGTQQRLVEGEAGSNSRAVWSPDGASVYYRHDPGTDPNIWRRRADRSSEPEPVLEVPGDQAPHAISADGTLLLYQSDGDIYLMNLDGDPDPRPVAATEAQEVNGTISPDGRYAAYQSNESGEPRIYVREIATNRQWPISTGVAYFARWSPRGDEIFYRLVGGEIMSVTVASEGELSPSAPVQVAELPSAPRGNFGVDHTGERFIFFSDPSNPQADADDALYLGVVVNWFEELKQRLPPN